MSGALVLLAGFTACSDYALTTRPGIPEDAEPDIEVSPLAVDFGALPGGEAAVREVTVRNLGAALLTVEAPAISGDEDFVLLDEAAFGLEGGLETALRVEFTGREPAAQDAVLTLGSNDPDTPLVEVPLAGLGLVPWLEITPATHDFGAVPIPCDEDVQLVLQNVGNADLEVDALAYVGDEQLRLVEAPEAPFDLAPGACAFATVVLEPSVSGAIEGRLRVNSNDPRGEIEAVQQAAPAWAGARSEDFLLPEDPSVDVLFAVDRSGSMDDDAQALGEAFGTFLATLGAATGGWQIGVLTWDHGCLNHGVLSEGTPDLEAVFLDAITQGSDAEVVLDEQLFQIVDRALQQTATGACNEGFLRAGAPLHVVFVSDEPERSTETASAWTWDWFLARWDDLAPNTLGLKVSGVVDLEDCNEGAAGYLDAVGATGGLALSICDADWGASAEALALESAETLFAFPLAELPDPATLEVLVDGEHLEHGWSWDAGVNAVILDLDVARAITPGAVITVRYNLVADCGA